MEAEAKYRLLLNVTLRRALFQKSLPDTAFVLQLVLQIPWVFLAVASLQREGVVLPKGHCIKKSA